MEQVFGYIIALGASVMMRLSNKLGQSLFIV